MNQNQIRVFKDTKKRANEFAAYTDANGTSYPWVPRDLLEVVDLPVPPADYSEELYCKKEIVDAPYVLYELKSAEQVGQERKAKLDAKLALVRQVREGILNRLAGIAFAAQLSGDTATATAFVTVRQGLLDITTGLTDHATVEAEVTARYAAIVAQCTPAMVSAFAQVDA